MCVFVCVELESTANIIILKSATIECWYLINI